MVSNTIFGVWADRAVESGEIAEASDYRPTREDFNAMFLDTYSIMADVSPNILERTFSSLATANSIAPATSLTSPSDTPVFINGESQPASTLTESRAVSTPEALSENFEALPRNWDDMTEYTSGI